VWRSVKQEFKYKFFAEMKEEEENKSEAITECLICGKLFPRGPIDLARYL
jgi:hypothetical protein